MTTYSARDIASTFEGDILLNSNGDLALANSLNTHKSAANYVLRTDHGDYQADVDVGCNLGSYVGELNIPRVHTSMEHNISKVLQNEIFSPTDVQVSVVPFDTEEALAVVTIAGYYLIDNEIVYVDNDIISYSFPFLGGTPSPLTI